MGGRRHKGCEVWVVTDTREGVHTLLVATLLLQKGDRYLMDLAMDRTQGWAFRVNVEDPRQTYDDRRFDALWCGDW